MDEIILRVQEPDAVTLQYVEAKTKPEQVGHATPDWEPQTVRPDPGCVFSEVDIDGMPEPTDVMDISENGDHNVARYGTARVNVPQGYFPQGTLEITENGTDINVTEYAAVDVNVNPSGWVFDEFDQDGWPTRAKFYATAENSIIPNNFIGGSFNSNAIPYHITKIELSEGTTSVGYSAFERRLIKKFVMPSTVTSVGSYVFRNCTELEEFDYMGDCYFYYYDFLGTALKRLTAHKNVTKIQGTNIFPSTTELIDFSHCTSVPPLSHAGAFDLVVSCRMLVPAALFDEWQNTTNWNALTNVTLEGV